MSKITFLNYMLPYTHQRRGQWQYLDVIIESYLSGARPVAGHLIILDWSGAPVDEF